MIPYGKQTIEVDDIQAVCDVLKSDYLTQGLRVREFEERFADYVDAKYAVAVCNGTAALHLAALVTPKRRIASMPTLTFVATANALKMAGIEPVFRDIGDDFNSEFVDVSVDFAGLPTWSNGVIEDACHALGAKHPIITDFESGKIEYELVGHRALLTCFSFHPVKAITTGEGGMVTTNNPDYYEHLKVLRDHGRVNGECQELGYNYRMDEMSAALGLSQLRKIDRFLERRKEIAYKYCRAFDMVFNENHAYHLFVILVDNRDQVKARLLDMGISTQVHYKPIHLLPAYNTGLSLPKSEAYYKRCLSLPIYPTLKDSEVDHVINSVRQATGQSTWDS